MSGDTLTYDAENRVISAYDSATNNTETYAYDGNGQRVTKSGPAGTTTYIYDAFGNLTAEYGTMQGNPPCTTCYLSYDWLGSVRLVTDASGNVKARHDFLPFGEEIPVNTAGRNGQWGSTSDVEQKFTGKERDQETGLDYFGARYYGNALGRFTSPDPYEIVEHKDQGNTEQERRSLLNSYISNPQAWNKYAYGLDNPLRNIDVGGNCSAPAGLNSGQTGVCIETFIASKHIGGIGLGDNRTFSPNGGSYRFRVDVRIDPGRNGKISINSDAAKSSVLVEGLGFKGHGTATLSPVTTDESGNRTFTVSGSAVNGEQFINNYVPIFNPAPQGDINFDLTFTVSPSGNVTLDQAESRTFPSLEIYSYDSSGNVKQDVFNFSEHNPSDLTKPKQCIGGTNCPQ